MQHKGYALKVIAAEQMKPIAHIMKCLLIDLKLAPCGKERSANVH